MQSSNPTTRRTTLSSFTAGILCVACCQYSNVSSVRAFTLPTGSTRTIGSISSSSALSSNKDNLFFATVVDEKEESNPKTTTQEGRGGDGRKGVQLFSEETLREANEALTSVGWSGVAPASTSSLNISEDEMGQLTSDDPFVQVKPIIPVLLFWLCDLFCALSCCVCRVTPSRADLFLC